MDKRLLAGLVIVLVVGAAGAAAFSDVLGPSGDDGEEVGEPFPTQTSAAPTTTAGTTSGGSGGGSGGGDDGSGSGGSGTTATTTTAAPEPFDFRIGSIEECGSTCRDVTVTLTNQQETTAEDVTVYSRIFVGKGTDGDVVWQDSEDLGDLSSDESVTRTKRVELSFSEAYAVQQNDGWITIQTTIQTADRTVTFTDQRQVA